MRMRSWAIGRAWQEYARLQDLHVEACWIFPESVLYGKYGMTKATATSCVSRLHHSVRVKVRWDVMSLRR